MRADPVEHDVPLRGNRSPHHNAARPDPRLGLEHRQIVKPHQKISHRLLLAG
jgi:hypothetical protein